MVDVQQHWQDIWKRKHVDEVSWFQSSADTSVRLIAGLADDPDAAIIDVGGGASPLAGQLVERGYTDVTVLDVSEAALQAGRDRLGETADRITWVVGDVTSHAFDRAYDVWHDRAVLHFLIDDEDAARYVGQLESALADGGAAVIAPFGPNGPTQCSGLDVRRYAPETLTRLLGEGFSPVHFETEVHTTPSDADQEFLYGVFRRT